MQGNRIYYIATSVLGIGFGVLTFFFIYRSYFVSPNHIISPVVLTPKGEVESAFSKLKPTQTPIPTSSPIPRPTLIILSKKNYSVAIYGDSMVDTMGENLEYLANALKSKYPQTHFNLYNYGIGSQNIVGGLARFNNAFSYQTRNYPPLPQIRPDILIVGSFAYNPLEPPDINRYYSTVSQLVQAAKSVSSQVYMLAETAPLRKDFGKGPGGVNWSDDTSYSHSADIIQLMESDIALSKTLNVPLINAFYPSISNASTKEGTRSYVATHDGIHPSVLGHQFIANIIVNTIKLH